MASAIHGLEEFQQFNAQYSGDFLQRVDTRIFLSAFDAAKIGAINASIECKLLLRNSLGNANALQILPDKFPPSHGHDGQYLKDIKPLDISIILLFISCGCLPDPRVPMRFPVAVICAAFLVTSTAFASEPMAPVEAGRSATKARDINGFELGMPIQTALKRVKLTFQQGELFETTLDGISYDFGVCPSGLVYRIESRQELGTFIPDKVFSDKLMSQLFAKYGATEANSPLNLSWNLVEPVQYSDGETRLFKTNWFSVLVSGGYGSPLSLDMRMLDFRVCWDHKVRMNKAPRDQANEKIKF